VGSEVEYTDQLAAQFPNHRLRVEKRTIQAIRNSAHTTAGAEDSATMAQNLPNNTGTRAAIQNANNTIEVKMMNCPYFQDVVTGEYLDKVRVGVEFFAKKAGNIDSDVGAIFKQPNCAGIIIYFFVFDEKFTLKEAMYEQVKENHRLYNDSPISGRTIT